ncbi:MAG: bifunctional DNA-formamidopyrimidine glycosylase/DNA-(apurinic or apyrimidinic site) lyase [Pseudomonadota bacterium]|nr:bifunctional DNA-formamidopyrimidine glycosylase/DNA-(apurinic or apyrimidinic site) lyase [Pseudomonadota bacterium]
MPELPEVETVCAGLQPYVGEKVVNVTIRQPSLRWAVPDVLKSCLNGLKIKRLSRRGKYLLFEFQTGYLMVHLGMSGCLYIESAEAEWKKHDHIFIKLESGFEMRYHDPRRFGSMHWVEGDPMRHRLLVRLGPEPLTEAFSAHYLYSRIKGKKKSIKATIMDHHVVVGVGNIYAAESLFYSGIHPLRPCSSLSLKSCAELVKVIKQKLQEAIKQGGTTLRDFRGSDNRPGYFKQSLAVYAREGLSCHQCGAVIESVCISQRASAYCPSCQPL